MSKMRPSGLRTTEPGANRSTARLRPARALLRVLWGGGGNNPVVEVTSPVTGNPLHTAFCALRTVGVQVVHAAVHRSGDRMVQRLALRETDGTELSRVRLLESLSTLRSVYSVSRVHQAALAGALGMGA